MAAQLEGSVQGAGQRIMDVGEAQVPDAAKWLQISICHCQCAMGVIKLMPEVSQAPYLLREAQAHAGLRKAA